MTDYNKEIHVIGAFVHGVLTGFHGLGIFYNIRRKNKYDTLAHGAALAYDLFSVYVHYKEIKKAGLEKRL